MAYAYQRSNYGDYYQAGGLFGTIGGIIKKVGGAVIRRSPIGAAAGAAIDILTSKKSAAAARMVPPPPGGTIQAKALQKYGEVLGPGTEGTMVGRVPRKRRVINYGNVKALKRADKRIDGFVTVARAALKHTNYKVVSRSAGRGRGGSPGVITAAEARRALRS